MDETRDRLKTAKKWLEAHGIPIYRETVYDTVAHGVSCEIVKLSDLAPLLPPERETRPCAKLAALWNYINSGEPVYYDQFYMLLKAYEADRPVFPSENLREAQGLIALAIQDGDWKKIAKAGNMLGDVLAAPSSEKALREALQQIRDSTAPITFREIARKALLAAAPAPEAPKHIPDIGKMVAAPESQKDKA